MNTDFKECLFCKWRPYCDGFWSADQPLSPDYCQIEREKDLPDRSIADILTR